MGERPEGLPDQETQIRWFQGLLGTLDSIFEGEAGSAVMDNLNKQTCALLEMTINQRKRFVASICQLESRMEYDHQFFEVMFLLNQVLFDTFCKPDAVGGEKSSKPVHLAHLNLAGVKEALDNRGYGSEDILYAAFESFNQDNKAVYKIRYEDVDTPGGIGEGHVYLWEEDGKLLADF